MVPPSLASTFFPISMPTSSAPVLSEWERRLADDSPIPVAADVAGENGPLMMDAVWLGDCKERLTDAASQDAAGRAALAMQGKKEVTDVHADPSSYTGRMILCETGETVSYTIAERGNFITSLTIADKDGVVLATMGEPRTGVALDVEAKAARAQRGCTSLIAGVGDEASNSPAMDGDPASSSRHVDRAEVDAYLREVISTVNRRRDSANHCAPEPKLRGKSGDAQPVETIEFRMERPPIYPIPPGIRVYKSYRSPFPR